MPLDSICQAAISHCSSLVSKLTSHLFTTTLLTDKSAQCLLYAPKSTSLDRPPSSPHIQRDIFHHHAPQRLAPSPPLTRQTFPSTLRQTQLHTRATMIHHPAGFLESLRARNTRRKDGRMRGCMGIGAVCCWGL